jgi:hypothetical protein
VSKRINLDLSLLVALVSDLTHSQLPTTIEEAEARFTPGVAYHAWKASRILAGKAKAPDYANASAKGTVAQTRALALQAMQEVRHGIIEEIRARLDRAGHMEDVEFWTSAEARTRCLRIVGKIGGPTEKRPRKHSGPAQDGLRRPSDYSPSRSYLRDLVASLIRMREEAASELPWETHVRSCLLQLRYQILVILLGNG